MKPLFNAEVDGSRKKRESLNQAAQLCWKLGEVLNDIGVVGAGPVMNITLVIVERRQNNLQNVKECRCRSELHSSALSQLSLSQLGEL